MTGAGVDFQAPKGTPPLIQTQALEVGYLGHALLAPLELCIEAGQFWCVLGRNGAGKTTLLRTLLGLLPPVAGQRSTSAGLRVGYLPQQVRFDELYPMSARDVVLMGVERGLSFLKRRPKEAAQHVDAVLKSLDLESLGSRRFSDLSGGQKQRVLLARLSAGRPTLAFLDEPTTAMDQASETLAFEHLLQRQQQHGCSFVVVTHDFWLAQKYADHALFVDDRSGRVVLGRAREVLASQALQRRYRIIPGGAAP